MQLSAWQPCALPPSRPRNGGTGKALVYYGARNQKFREAFPDWREPFVEKQTAFRDR